MFFFVVVVHCVPPARTLLLVKTIWSIKEKPQQDPLTEIQAEVLNGQMLKGAFNARHVFRGVSRNSTRNKTRRTSFSFLFFNETCAPA